MDSTREIRAMIMASFPSPPIPLSDGGNSHDMIAYLIDVAARRQNPQEDMVRREKQESLCLDYCDDVGNCTDETELFNCMTRFNREYMLTYCPIMHEIRFLPFDAIKPPLKKLLCSWIAAQKILQGEDSRGEEFEHFSPLTLYFIAAETIKNAKSVAYEKDWTPEQDGKLVTTETEITS